jgi:arylsulfatase A-like enzyme/tetratricopeptide (TPR) repeat protein
MPISKKISLALAAVLTLLAAAAAVFLLWGGGKAPAQVVDRLWKKSRVDKPNVIIFTVDTTRADHLACYGYSGVETPNLDSLARRGVLFEQCETSSPLTLPAHSTIMTGVYPTYHGVRVNGNTALSDEQTTLAEILSGRGYDCGAFVGAFVLDGRWGLKQGFSHYDDQFDLRKYKQLDLGLVQRPGNQVMDAALTWLEGEKEKPFFAWIHLYDPHVPYEPPEPYLSRYRTRPKGLYDGEIAFTDEQVGRCLTWLQKNGLDRKTIIVVVGDHGESLGDHGENTHGFFIYESTAHVPLIISVPLGPLQGRRVASQVRTVDILATTLQLARLEAPAKTQGTSLLPLLMGRRGESNPYAYSESMAPNLQFGWAALHALKTERFKFIEAPRLELYDLQADPGERQNILDRNPAEARRLKGVLDNLVAETSRGAPEPQSANLDKDTLERLAALGYVGAPVAQKKARGEGQFLADPKDKLPVFEAVQRAGELIMQEKYAEAVADLESSLKGEPEIPQALLLLSTCYSELGRKDEAKASLDTVLKEDPANVPALIALANILLEEGKGPDVIALCKRTLAIDNRNPQAYMLAGEVYMDAEDHAQALPYLEKAVDLQPKVSRNRLNLAACLVGLKRFDQAEPMLRDLVREFPDYPFAHFNLGLLYEEQGRWEEAREAYAREVELFPKGFRARFNLGKVLLRLGDRAGYIREMREVMTNAPRQPEGYLFLARGLLAEGGSLEEVRGLVDQGLALAGTSELKALGYFLLADVYNRQGRPDKVQEALKLANSYKNRKE